MPRLRKFHPHGYAVYLTTSVEEDFMFPPNPLIREVILSSLAKAQLHHPGITICHFIVSSTHVHIVAYIENPLDVKGFMERFKTESAHAVNKLLGRKKRTVWCEGYDSPVFLTKEAVEDKIAYTYQNPAQDELVESIADYPGLSSWNHFLHHKTTYQAHLIPRDGFYRLPHDGVISENEYRAMARKIRKGRKKITFKISPNAWMKAFKINDNKEQSEINEKIKIRIREKESQLKITRSKRGKTVLGKKDLVTKRIGAEYRPERTGKKMLCISSDKEQRRKFIKSVSIIFDEARYVWSEWLRGNINMPFPLGLYAPCLPRLAERWESPEYTLAFS